MSEKPMRTFTIRFPEDDFRALTEYAQQNGLKVADVIRLLVKYFLRNKNLPLLAEDEN